MNNLNGMENEMSELQNKVEQLKKVLQQAVLNFSPLCFANSLGAEDMVLTDIIAKHRLDIEIFSLDTNLLPDETYALIKQVRNHYGIALQVHRPDPQQIAEYIAQHGKDGFYESVEARKRCCYIRKVEPLRHALEGKRAWITGMRREQAATRGNLEVSSFDADNGLQKFNPLLDWTNAEVWEYIKTNDVPYNALHDRLYPSIGCAPCTRAITPGEDIRAGRWWWERPESKECGLHVGGKFNRASNTSALA